MRKVMDDLVVPQSLAAPSESGQYVIPKGYFVLASPSVAGVDPLVWRDPREWEPSRWMDNGAGAMAAFRDEATGEKVDYGFGMISKGTESPYQPFGAGRHRCIGEQFAYVQLGCIVSTITRNMEMRMRQPFPAHNYHTMIVLPTNPCNIECRVRASA